MPDRGMEAYCCILIACVGHSDSQAPHWMHSLSFAGSDFFSEVGCPGVLIISNTLTGQTPTHISSPLHISWSTATLVPCMPSCFGGARGPHILCPACSPAGFLLVWKFGSIPMGNGYEKRLLRILVDFESPYITWSIQTSNTALLPFPDDASLGELK